MRVIICPRKCYHTAIQNCHMQVGFDDQRSLQGCNDLTQDGRWARGGYLKQQAPAQPPRSERSALHGSTSTAPSPTHLKISSHVPRRFSQVSGSIALHVSAAQTPPATLRGCNASLKDTWVSMLMSIIWIRPLALRPTSPFSPLSTLCLKLVPAGQRFCFHFSSSSTTFF